MCILAGGLSKSVFFRVLCETVKDFVAKVGRAYEKNTENSEESEAMAKKVSCDWLLDNSLFCDWLLEGLECSVIG